MKKIILLPILALLILGCCGFIPWGGSKDEFEMIPKTANAVVIIKPSSILNDSDFTSLSSSEIDNEIKQTEETTGMDPEKIDRLILFFKLDSLSQQSVTYTGFIAKGAIDKDKVLEKMEQDNTVNELNYSNHVMYEMSPKEMPQNKSYFTFIGGNILTGGDVLIGGTEEAVKDSIDVDAGKGESIRSRGNLSKIYDKFDKNSIFIFMIESSSDIKQEINNQSAAQLNIKALSHADSLGLSLNKVEKNIDLRMIILADEAAGASAISKLLDTAVSIVKTMSQSDTPLKNLLTKIKIEKTGNEISVNFSSTFGELKAAYNGLSTTSAITTSGWHTCNNVSEHPCDAYQGVYCDKFNPIDINVREAASAAISNHPGPYSVNQILDVYDWVHEHIIYQNVPVNLTYEPYSPDETLKTGSGDCKNQAVLIASMIEAIGGSARILLIPDCQHAFAEVYIGGNETKNRFVDATFAHYAKAPEVNWHTSKNDTEIWFPLDTAGGRYPGNTIQDCFNASQTFVIYNCNLQGWEWKAPNIGWIEYGPFKLYDKNLVIEPSSWYYFTYSVNTSQYQYCTYNIKLTSKARLFDWYIIPATDYQNFKNGYSYKYYYHEEQVAETEYNFTMSQPDKFNVIVDNSNEYYPMTVVTSISAKCYKK